MDEAEARFLTSEAGATLLAAARAARDLPLLRRAAALAGRGTPEEIRAALRQDDLRARALAKTPHADRLLLVPEALEQATAWPVAAERATRWPGAPGDVLHDLSAGLGFDALATAESGRSVVAWERDPVRAALLRHNARALGLADRVAVECRDVLSDPPSGALALLDPDRRPGGRRTRDPDRFEPPLTRWRDLLARFSAAMVKVGPTGAGPDAPEVPFEVVSLDGSLRERRLLLGAFASPPPRRALALPSGLSVEGTGEPWPGATAVEPGAYLLDPDPAVTVAGLVGDLARRDGLRPVHPRIAYLIAERPVAGAPGTWMRVDALLPARPREIRPWLSANGVGRLTIRERGIADPPETWRRRLRPAGPRAGTVALFRDLRDRWVAACSLDP